MEKFSQIKYVRPDTEAVKSGMLAALKKMKNAADYAEAKAAFFERQEIINDFQTANVIASIRNTMNTTDEFYADEIKYFNATAPQLAVIEKQFNEALLVSKFKADFDSEFGPQLIKLVGAEIKTQDESIVNELVREADLGTEYSKTAASCKTMFNGEECNFYGLLKHMLATDRDTRKAALKAWADLYEGVAPQLDAQYNELVKLRCAMAQKLGFNSYIDYIYLARHRFDYTAKDIADFRENVRKYIVPAAQKLYDKQAKRLGIDKVKYYDEQLVFPEGNADPIGDKDYLVKSAQQMYRELSPQTGEFFDFMVKHELFDLETRPGKHLGGYCTSLTKYKAPFIFSNFNGTSADVDVLTHEAGHAFMDYTSAKTQQIDEYMWSTSEVNEIHSMSMEFFAYPWMNKFFGENEDKYLYAHLADCLTVVPYLVSVDEFQHRVFEKPDMTAMERRGVWKEIEQKYLPWRDYDGNEFLDGGGFWMQKQHVFLYPFYYVDYALAQLCAFQFLIKMRADRGAAWNDYYRLCQAGGSLGYFDLLKYANLDNPFEEKTVKEVTEGVEKILDGMDF